jgi:hypothetical protein
MPRDDVAGNWYGMMVSTPHWGPIEVSFDGQDGSYTGQWSFPGVEGGAAKSGRFKAVRFENWLHLRITTKPLRGAEFRLTLLGTGSRSMTFGAIPLRGADFPFASVTLFRIRPQDRAMEGICPIRSERATA